MTLDQLKELKAWSQSSTDPNIIGSCFAKEFCEQLSSDHQELWDAEQKYKNLQELHAAAKSQGMPTSFVNSFAREMLAIGPKCGIYDKTLFKLLIKQMEEAYGSGGFMKNIGTAIKKSMEAHADRDWSNFIRNV